MLKNLKGYRTVAFGAAVAGLSLLGMLDVPGITALYEKWAAEGTTLVGLVIVVLRYVTDTPVGKSE